MCYSKNGGTSYTTYFYGVNAQGDVEKIFRMVLNSDTGLYEEKIYGRYTYDAWGSVTATTAAGNTPATTTLVYRNPIRYRGYVYDNETGFYYLLSRYYDPANHRFINADATEYAVMAAFDIMGANLFTYCFNNPLNMCDDSGNWPSWAKKAAAIAAAAVITVAAVVVTVATYGAGSVAGVAMISAAVAITAKTAEVAVLQGKKSSSEGKSAGEVATDIIESVYDNGDRILLGTTAGKAAGIAATNGLYNQIDRAVDSGMGYFKSLPTTLGSEGGKAMAIVGAAINVGNTIYAAICDDPIKRAEERGYTLK